MRKELIRYIFVFLIILFIGLFIYPTLYKYEKYGELPIKINRLTGSVEFLHYDGWRGMEDPLKQNDSPAPEAPPKEEDEITAYETASASDVKETTSPSYEHIEIRTAVVNLSTRKLEIEGLILDRIHFTDFNITGEVINNTDESIQISGLKFEIFDEEGNILPSQPRNESLFIKPGGTKPGDSEVFIIEMGELKSSIGKYRVTLSISRRS